MEDDISFVYLSRTMYGKYEIKSLMVPVAGRKQNEENSCKVKLKAIWYCKPDMYL